ncbi:MAG: hypothetical protein ACR2KP_17090 [Egibacteraceae bacterium]
MIVLSLNRLMLAGSLLLILAVVSAPLRATAEMAVDPEAPAEDASFDLDAGNAPWS